MWCWSSHFLNKPLDKGINGKIVSESKRNLIKEIENNSKRDLINLSQHESNIKDEKLSNILLKLHCKSNNLSKLYYNSKILNEDFLKIDSLDNFSETNLFLLLDNLC